MDKKQILDSILETPKKLSDSQRRAVISSGTHIRVIAGAGAGKTETLTRRIVKLLLVDDVLPSSIVAFTFTEKAAQSMKSRVYKRLKELEALDLCAQLGDLYIGTIHGYCMRLLEDHYGYGNYGVLDENQEMAFLLRMGWSLHLPEGHGYTSTCEAFMKNLNVVYGEMLDESVLDKRAPVFYRSFKEYEKALDEVHQLTFNRMINLAVHHLQKDPSIVSGITHLIVDEFQDINRAHDALIKLIGSHANVFIVGDPRQTVYQWRGSDERCFDEYARVYTDVETIPIRENRRSSTSIVSVSNHFSDNFVDHRYEKMVATRPDAGGTYYVECRSNEEEARWISDQIQAYVDGGRCNYGDIAILLRSVNSSGPPFIDEFRHRGIPFIVGGKVGLFRRSEAQAVGKLIAWLSDRGFFQKNKWAFRDKLDGDDLLTSAIIDWHDAVPEIVLPPDIDAKLRAWKQNVAGGIFPNFARMYDALLTELGFHQLDHTNREHAVVMANLGRFSELLADYETANMLGGKRRNWASDMNGLCWYINSYAMSSYEEQVGDDLRGIDAIQMMTIHQSKGLEWPLVFVPAVVDGRFPTRMMGKHGIWYIPRDMFDATKYEGTLESERNLLYVALTRAKDVLVVSSFGELRGRHRGISVLLEEGDWLDATTRLNGHEQLPSYSLLIQSIDDDELQTYSASEVIKYGRCPYMYCLGEVWGYQPGLSEYLGYGRALHHCLRHAGELIMDDGCGPISAVVTAMDREFYMPFMPPGRAADIKKAAKESLIRFVRKYEQDMLRVRDMESRIEFPLKNAIVAGRVDVILNDEKAIEVREYKSADTAATPEEVAMQVRLYTKGLRGIGENVRRGSVAYLQDVKVENVNVDDKAVETVVDMTEQYIEGIKAKRFIACPGQVCERCDQKDICRWRAKI